MLNHSKVPVFVLQIGLIFQIITLCFRLGHEEYSKFLSIGCKANVKGFLTQHVQMLPVEFTVLLLQPIISNSKTSEY